MRRLAPLVLLFTLGWGTCALAQSKKKEESTVAEPWMNTRITFSFGDDNVLLDAGESKRNSPMAWFGSCPPAGATADDPTGCGKNLTDLVLYKRLKLSPFFQPEAALALSIDVMEGMFQDAGSYVRANFFMDDRHETYWAVTLFPVDADRLRLGYYYDVSWGGTDVFPKNYRDGYAPGLKYDLDMRYWHLFVGAKAARLLSPAADTLDNPGGNTIKNVERTYYGVLGGLGFEVLDTGLRFEMNGAFFHKGNNPRMNALGKAVYSGGGSARLSFRRGLAIGNQIDLRIHQQDPVRDQLFKKERYRTGDVSVAVEAEGTFLVQTLEDPDRVDSTKNEMSWMAHAGFKLKYDFFRLFLHFIYRDLTAVTFDAAGLVPYQALSENTEVTPEISGQIAADFNIQPYDITLGLGLLVLKPASYIGTATAGATAGPADQGLRKTVVRGPLASSWDLLPPGEDELPVFLLRMDVKWSYYEAFGVLLTLFYQRDENVTQVVQDDEGHNMRQFDEPNAFGFNVMAQLQF